MSDRDEEGGKGFKVTDRRRFTIDESGKVIAAEGEEESRESGEKKETPPSSRAETEGAAGAGGKPKASLRERVMAKLSGKKEKAEETEGRKPQGPLPEIDFLQFVMSLSSSALIHFGEIEDPITGERGQNLPAAKQTIDILGMLQEKTKGNLSDEEDRIFSALLSDLRLRYVELKKKG